MSHSAAPLMPGRSQKIAVECQGVSKEFSGQHGVRALNDIDLTLGEGEFAAVLGPSGCGKSTLLNIIAGFEQASSGTVSFYGSPVTKPGLDRAVVFQEPALFPWLTVWENVIFSPKVNGRKKSGLRVRSARLSRPRRPEQIRAPLSGSALGRHEAAGRHRARAPDEAQDVPDG
jgi:ABC-type taurine transport system ATPase subunit